MLQNSFSCYTETLPSLIYALTAKNQYNSVAIEDAPSIIEVVKNVGLKTVWISNQIQVGNAENMISFIANDADNKIWLNSSEIKSISFLRAYDERVLKEVSNIDDKYNGLVVIHLMGSHNSYKLRYPEKYNIFGEKTLDDMYDNTVRYNDYVVASIYSILQSKRNFAAMIYFSDHGEQPTGNALHNKAKFSNSMVRIPTFFFFSDKYIKENKEKVESIRENREKFFTNDLIYNAVLGVMNIRLKNDANKNDFTSHNYDADVLRFRTMYGQKKL